MAAKTASATYKLSKKTVDTLQAMSDHTGKGVDELVETALKFFIATHNDYLGQTFIELEARKAKK